MKVLLIDMGGGVMCQIILTFPLLPPLNPMGQSWRGVVRMLEAQVRLLVAAIPRFIQLGLPLPPRRD
jgi:hypothetical protein